jgi:hypothetical protein
VGRRVNYANVTATLALFFAMSGGALAAKHYLISSTKQISPKVLKALKGNEGLRGLTGVTGATGAPGKEGPSGKEGKQGEPGPLLETLPSGKTERGSYGFASNRPAGGFTPGWETSYPIPISFTPTINIVKSGGAPTASCPGSVAAPAAAAGKLCLYNEREDFEIAVETLPAPGHFGFLVFSFAPEGKGYENAGSWAVTAP